MPRLKFTVPLTMMATITPKSPRALPKISTTRIFTNSVLFWASDSAQLLPIIPTQSLERRAGGVRRRLAGKWTIESHKIHAPEHSATRYEMNDEEDAPANEVCEADGNPRAEDAVAGEHCRSRVRAVRIRLHILNLRLKDNGDDNPVDSRGLAEDDAERVAIRGTSRTSGR